MQFYCKPYASPPKIGGRGDAISAIILFSGARLSIDFGLPTICSCIITRGCSSTLHPIPSNHPWSLLRCLQLAPDLGSDSNKAFQIEPTEKDAPGHYSTNFIYDDGGHILDANQLGAGSEGVQTTPDKNIILIPQPLRDPNDPLNWSSLKKHTILLVVTVTAFMPDFGSSMGIIALLPQAT